MLPDRLAYCHRPSVGMPGFSRNPTFYWVQTRVVGPQTSFSRFARELAVAWSCTVSPRILKASLLVNLQGSLDRWCTSLAFSVRVIEWMEVLGWATATVLATLEGRSTRLLSQVLVLWPSWEDRALLPKRHIKRPSKLAEIQMARQSDQVKSKPDIDHFTHRQFAWERYNRFTCGYLSEDNRNGLSYFACSID